MLYRVHFFLAAVLGLLTSFTWGQEHPPASEVAPPAAYEKQAMISAGVAAEGRRLFFEDQRLKCSQCHRVAGQGAQLGPDLSSIGGKFDRAHLIESILDPSAQIVEGFRTTKILTTEGKVLLGIVRNETDTSFEVATADAKVEKVLVKDVEQREPSKTSTMPSGIWQTLNSDQFTDLIAYLESLSDSGASKFGAGISGPIALPDGFGLQVVARNLSGSTALEVLPDGRVLVCEQTGTVRVIERDVLIEQPLLTLPVDSFWERGVIGVTVDPKFTENGFVYVCWVAKEPYPHHRVTRYYMQGNSIVPGSEKLLIEGDDQRTMGGNVPAGHQGGALHFGNDGKLYIAIGEQTAGKPSQAMDTFLGKILRINSDGSIPEDNPFLGETSGKYRAIWARGLRNPFTFAIRASDGQMLINDVGGNFEEINRGRSGANYGWPTIEHGFTTAVGIDGPIACYPQSSIAGGAFIPEGISWPNELTSKYLYADFVHGWIKLLDTSNPAEEKFFAKGLRRPVDMRFSMNGDLYVLLRNAWVVDDKFVGGTGSLIKISRVKATDTLSDSPLDKNLRIHESKIRSITVSDVVLFDEIDCYRIQTPTATYVVGKRGAGLVSMIDSQGNDWISYRPGNKAAGEYRGLPKCGQPNKFFHCGYGYGQYQTENPFHSEIVLNESEHVRIRSTSKDQKSIGEWDFYATHATFRLIAIDQARYWFLYEGTPGGKLEVDTDYVVRPGNHRTFLNEPWRDNIPWVYFGAAESRSAMFLINHQEHASVDSYVSWPYKADASGSLNEMTVFGFGRPDWQDPAQHSPPLVDLPASFSIGFAPNETYEQVSSTIESIIRQKQK